MGKYQFGKYLLLLVILVAGIGIVSAQVPVTNYSVSTHIDETNATPIEIWAISILLGIGLFLMSLSICNTSGECERNAVISVLAWVPIGYAAYTSFVVDRYMGILMTDDLTTAVEMHTIYHFDVIGILMVAFLLAGFINTYRILSMHKALSLQSDTSQDQRSSGRSPLA